MSGSRNGVWGPKGLPADLVTKLQTEIAKAVADPSVKERLETLGFEPVGSTTDYFAKYIAEEMAKSAKIIDDAKIKTE